MKRVSVKAEWKICVRRTAIASAASMALLSLGIANAAGDGSPEGLSATPAGWSQGQVRADFWKYKDEKPVATITASNVAQYADKLSPGQLELFKSNPSYEMVIYPTHRDCGFPDWINQNTTANKSKAKLDASGNYLADAVLPGVVFPDPKNGAEAMWNFQTRYTGIGDLVQWRTYVSPSSGGSDPIITMSAGGQYTPWGKKGQASPAQVNELQSGNVLKIISPAALAGQAGVFRNYFSNKEQEGYYYFPGQRRVRRMPSYSYDAPQIGYENQYTVDEVYVFYGAIDRYNWKLAGKKELYVPYNDFGMYKFKDDFKKVMSNKGIDPQYRRYELHEVYVVEGTLKSDVRHISAKKVFYFDPDSWNILSGEDYDAQGKLFKYREAYSIPTWDLGGVCTALPTYQFNFQSGRYVADNLLFGLTDDVRYYESPEGHPEFTDEYYTSQGLQSISER
jgi:hypothetical protein